MKSQEIYESYMKAFSERWELEKKIEDLMKRWVQGEITLSSTSIQISVDKGYERLDNLKQIEEMLHQDYLNQIEKEKAKKAADQYLSYRYGTRPSDKVITEGVLASNASESHLVARPKTREELEMEMEQHLNNIKTKCQKGELNLEQATKLIDAINTSYGYMLEETENKARH